MPATLEKDSLAALMRARDPHRFITDASAALARGADDDGLRLALIRRLAEQGLMRRAAEVADGCSAVLESNPEFAAMRSNLATADPDGQISWSGLSRRYDANIAALGRRGDCADQVNAAWTRERESLELHQTRDGIFQVLDRRGGGARWRPAFGDLTPNPPVAELAKQFRNQVLAPVILEGVGLGAHLPWLVAATQNTLHGAAPVVYQIEPSLVAVAVALHLCDWRDALDEPRVRLCFGSEAYAQFEQMVATDEANPPPTMTVRAPAWSTPDGPPLGELVDASARRFESRRALLRESVSEVYRGRGRSYWGARYRDAIEGDGGPLRVLGLTCRFSTVLQYSMRDMLQAFRDNDCEIRLLIEPDDHSRTTPITMLSAIRDFEPDLVMIIDHARPGQAAGLVDNVPLLTWVQDRMPQLFTRETGEALGPLDFCMGFARDELVNRCGYPADQFMPCEMATDQAALFEPGEDLDEVILSRRDERDPEFECDVAFATSHSQSPAEAHQEYRSKCVAEVARFLDAAYDELNSLACRSELNGGLALTEFVRRIETATGLGLSDDHRVTVADEYVRPMADKILRHQSVEWAADWADQTDHKLHLYGNGWEKHPRFAKYARGFVTHGPVLGRVFRAAKVSLHAGCNRALHQRVLDGLAAGGFFLIRRHADDIEHRLWKAMHEMARRGEIRPGDTLRWDDYPAALLDELLNVRRMRGYDPYVAVDITQKMIDRLRQIHESGEVCAPATIWPNIERVTYGTCDEMCERLEFFVSDDDARRAIARSMRDRVLDEFSYRSLAGKLLRWLARSL